MEVKTKYGQRLVSEHLLQQLIHQVRRKRITINEAALELGKQCMYCFFYLERAGKIIDERLKSQ